MDEKVYITRKGIALRAQARGVPLTINRRHRRGHRRNHCSRVQSW